MDTLLQDLRFALRALAKRPDFTVAAVLTLGLGIGAKAGVFTVVNQIFFKPPAQVARPEELVGPRYSASSWMDYIDFRRGSGDVLQDLAFESCIGMPASRHLKPDTRHPTPT